MMRLITEYDVKMTKELAKWSVYPKDDSDIYLREDAPEEVKKFTRSYEEKIVCLIK